MTMHKKNVTVILRQALLNSLCLVTFLGFGRSSVAQNSADNLYLAVQQLQLALGDSEKSDEIRDRFYIRQLETESARGFSGNAAVLVDALAALSSADALSPALQNVRDRLVDHVAILEQAGLIDLEQFLAGLAAGLDDVSLESLAKSRDEVVAALLALDEFDQEELSEFGRYYLNKRLGLPNLAERLEGLNFEVLDISLPDDIDLGLGGNSEGSQGQTQDELNRDLNTLRGELRDARQRFALATTDYPNLVIARAEKRIAGFQQQVTAYLLSQTTRALQAFQQDFSQRYRVLQEDSPASRLYQAELGRLLGLLEDRQQTPGVSGAVRQLFSGPNLKVTVEESIVNLLGGQTVSQIEHLDEVILGSRAQGWVYTSGLVSVDFINNPYSAHVRLRLNANLQTQAYTKEGPVTAYTSTMGMASVDRDVTANVGNVSVFPVTASASMASDFLGTDKAPLIDRIAFRRYSQKKFRAEEIAAERAEIRLRDEFDTETGQALDEGLQQLQTVRDRRGDFLARLAKFRRKFSEILAENEAGNIEGPVEMVDPFVLPRLFVTSTDSQLNIGGTLEGENRLAAPTAAPETVVPAEFRFQIHESLLSNMIAPLIQDRLLQNWQFGRIAEGLSSGKTELPKPENDRRWAIRFEDGRPIQVEFENNEIVITVYGKEFRQERRLYADPIHIAIRMRIVDIDGTLKLVRSGKAEVDFTYPPAEGKTLDPDAIAFRQFLQDNLDAALSDDPLEQAIELPGNLLPIDYVDDEQLKRRMEDARLVEFWMANGWLTMGWNYLPPQRVVGPQAIYTPGIGRGWPPATDGSRQDDSENENLDDI